MQKSVKFSEDYFLVSQQVGNEKSVNVDMPVNHIITIDVSGSMYDELLKIRTQLKNKLSNLVKENDTISIVWFSGRGEAGILKEEVEVRSLKTLSDLNSAIDKWLQPVGLTGFYKPLVLVKELIARIRINRPNSVFSLMFLTDGWNNSANWSDVLNALKDLENDLASSCFIEYGNYADSKRLTEMASILGGEKVSCSSFDTYEPIFEKKIKTSISGGKKTLVEIKDNYLYDFVFSITKDNAILLYNINDGKVLVGSDVSEIYFFSDKEIGSKWNSKIGVEEQNDLYKALYASIYVLSDKILFDDAEKIFNMLPDPYQFSLLSNAYGKQKLMAFKDGIKECVEDKGKRFVLGMKEIEPINENAFCLMNLMKYLGANNCLFYPNDKEFVYNRIGRKKVSAGNRINENDKQRIAECTDIKELSSIVEELKSKVVDLKFVPDEPNKGYSMSDCVWNEERANLSVRVKINGKVQLPDNKLGLKEIASYKYRTFTIIKDGIVNVDKLPVGYDLELEKLLIDNKVKYTQSFDEITSVPYRLVIDLTSLPIINKSIVKSISAVDLGTAAYKLLKLQADAKVYTYFKKSLYPKESLGFIEQYGQEFTDWLKELGITEFNGFAPKTENAESSDTYMSVNLAVKIKGLSGLPSVDAVLKKIDGKKPLTLSESLMGVSINNYNIQMESDLYKSLGEDLQKQILKDYLTKKSEEAIEEKRLVMSEISKNVFAIILSKKWFKEFKSFDENTLTLTIDGQPLSITFALTEKEEEI